MTSRSGISAMGTVAGGLESLDDYRIVRALSQDGAAFLAHDRFLDRAVILTFLPDSHEARAERLAVARAVARISHPNLGLVHRVCEEGSRPYVIAAYARGPRLDTLVAPLPDGRVHELGRGLASALAVLHEAGVSHGDVRAGRVVLSDDGAPRLVGFDRARAPSDEATKRADVRALLALLRSLSEGELRSHLAGLADVDHGIATAEELRHSLEALARPSLARATLSENPYRGLRCYGREDAAVFFGREPEVALLLEKLGTQPWLLVAGRSGTGKSSLVRAGLAPRVAEGALGERAEWEVATVVPGARPVDALARALAPFLDDDASELAQRLRRDPSRAGRLVRTRAGVGFLLIVDQLEEVMSLASADERASFSAVLECFGALVPGVRVLFTLRADFLERLVELGAVGQDLARTAHILAPMGDEGLRAAIVAPARIRGFELETPAMVEALVQEVRHDVDALPLLSFALAELWAARDVKRHVIPEAALRSLGGAVAVLARHGDTVLATLGRRELAEARRILLALVTASATRARSRPEDLVGARGAAARTALEALVRGRLVVAGETCEIVHEALGRVWPRLHAWLEEASSARAAAARVTLAAEDWERAGRPADALLGERQLAEVDELADEALEGPARAFVAASRAAVHRARRRRRALRFGVPLGALVVLGLAMGGFRIRERQETRAFLAARLIEAEAALGEVRADGAKVETARADAFARFDARDAPGGEVRWREALTLAHREREAFATASAPLGLALARDPLDVRARTRTADLSYAWLLAAERDHDTDVARDLAARVAELDDDGSRGARLAASAHLLVTTVPTVARVVLHAVRADAEGRRLEDDGRAIDPARPLELAPGSYVLTSSAEGRYPTRLPLLLRRGGDERVELVLPAASDVPRGFVYVPAGTSLVGAADAEAVRSALSAEPEHPVAVGAFLIGMHEVTYAEYLAFLDALSPAERTERRPHTFGLDLVYAADGVPSLTLRTATARRGERLCRPKRSTRRCQDWLRFPIAGISPDDAQAYVAWLGKGPVRGARLCSDREWERAARGADGRLYPQGDALHAGEANFDETYGSDPEQLGVDEVGSFPADRSPFGVLDMAGNLAEWVGAREARGARGGYWDDVSFLARAASHSVHGGVRAGGVGLRVCADAPGMP